MVKVYAARCSGYDDADAVIKKGIETLGGLEALLGSAMNIAVKPNLLSPCRPDECVTTHPEVMRSVLSTVAESGRKAKIVESPSGPLSERVLHNVYETAGMADAAQAAGAELNFDISSTEVSLENGRSVKNMRFLNAILESDAVISVAKLKTHTMVTYTGAVKNLFGTVPGTHKGESHFRLPKKDDFAGMLVDVAQFVNPRLSVIDGVWAMEGDGPSAGEKRNLGVIIISDSPYAADIVAGRIIGLGWQDNPVIKCAVDRGLCDPDAIEVLGDGVEALAVSDFKKPRVHEANILIGRIPSFLVKPISKRLVLYPEFVSEGCTGCATCVKNCPAGALKICGKLPKLERSKCINCFCCSEMCPEKAIRVHRPLVLRAMTKLFK